MGKNIKLSLIITTYNSPDYLELVLKSLLRLKEFPDEIIIADDGSGNETRLLIEKYQKLFPIPVIHSWIEDKGFRVAKSRNIAISKAKGDYIIILDGDMVVTPSFISDHRLVMEEKQFVSGSRARLPQKATEKRLKTKNPIFNFFSRGLSRRLVMLRIPFMHHFIKGRKGLSNARSCHAAFWKKDFIEINGFEENFEGWGYEDSELFQRFYNIGLNRKNMKLLAPAVHLFHNEKKDEKESLNKKRLQETIEQKKKYAQVGVNQYL